MKGQTGIKMGARQDKAEALFKEGYNCSQAVFGAFADIYGMDEKQALRIACSFGAGMGRMREVCGAASGMFMVAGLENGTTEGKDAEGKKANYDAVQYLAQQFKEKCGGSIVCRELLGLEQKESYKDTTPEERNNTYYTKRPCGEIVREAAGIVEAWLERKRA